MKKQAYHGHLIVIAIIFVAMGLGLRNWVGSRRFKRRNIAGLQQYSNYHHAVSITILERLTIYLANTMIAGGSFLYMIS